jgi:hypothetical protein
VKAVFHQPALAVQQPIELMNDPDGVPRPLPTFHVSITELTVGPAGVDRMPAALPPTSAYTYAVELGVDEAVTAGIERVDLSAPVAVYVDDFVGISAGARVPVGYYDRDRGTWVASPNGRVVKLLGVDDTGRAVLDLDGDEAPDTDAAHVDARLSDPFDVAVGPNGGIYVVELDGNQVWRIDPTGWTTHIAGSGTESTPDATGAELGDGGPAVDALLDPWDVAVDSQGRVYIADQNAHRVRWIDGAGIIHTLAGDGTRGVRGDGGLPARAQLDRPGSSSSDRPPRS